MPLRTPVDPQPDLVVSERPDELGQHVVHRVTGEVGPQLAVREPVRDRVREPQSQRGLADAGRAAQQRDTALVQGLAQRRKLVSPPVHHRIRAEASSRAGAWLRQGEVAGRVDRVVRHEQESSVCCGSDTSLTPDRV